MIKIILPTLFIGVLIGAFAGYTFGKPAEEKPVSQGEPTTKQPNVEKNVYNGNDLTLTEMYENLQEVTGDEFDHRLLMYEIAIKQNESGFLGMASEKSNQEAMKTYADAQIPQNDTTVRAMYDWQRDWGYNHH
jgi:hypothetical protein